ncbi:diacylglycerol kinase (ATP) [Winogradskyella eximia]|jgi:diacylglycerol kinase (ATP)|uniref:Diacylglycerol kinase (ATP) n=1 Tax=Winogradskyella eximia TaxID=262006 RepID=A0A3D9GQ89_9FLAO|nr:diacylglycerol kinase family protein [Winogradskyella eximia]RED38634.1 diacylglycerol kinase (ATP) [Winogradskyella eximia]|tara:strand:+ start:2115 stop:2483 length:369 start_codon:yes stop_codon:yes gene_type:complete
MQKKESFIVNRLKSIGFAFKGMLILIKTEASIKVQLCITIVITFAGFYFEISKTEWMVQLAMIGLVMSLEGMNTAIEHIADFIHPEYHKKIGLIKDVAAGAVFIAAIIATIIAGIIYVPKIF